MTTTVLTTERIRLRRFTPDDVTLLHRLDADPEVMAYLTGGGATPLEEIREQLTGYLDVYEKHDGPGHWPPRNSTARSSVGSPSNRVIRAWNWDGLRRESWGKGYAAETAIALVDAAFTRFGAERVWAQTMAVNRRSRRVMERTGLRYIRTFHPTFDDPIPGTEHGEVEYAITRQQWRRQA
ncbi:RimJ/RimL family protein N-acetyltransferase [Stackebrandtia endophytica]|uniref:RimJ/RimL family protein N-acetyltransferase n=1 Tax=Stackebrandtia endophytica TaxID=1496996 RepID=A0A543AVR0_9ACTN|nr:GNAT family N-acetyltransferase [Stackebrandtia endophytica]TQL76665.1 RimJ/RimL family protein N-acetyltransferase [Stackebrandtia endophytica]